MSLTDRCKFCGDVALLQWDNVKFCKYHAKKAFDDYIEKIFKERIGLVNKDREKC